MATSWKRWSSLGPLKTRHIRSMEIDKDYINSITEKATAFSLICAITILWLFSGKWLTISHVTLKKNSHCLNIWIKSYQYRNTLLPVKGSQCFSYEGNFPFTLQSNLLLYLDIVWNIRGTRNHFTCTVSFRRSSILSNSCLVTLSIHYS